MFLQAARRARDRPAFLDRVRALLVTWLAITVCWLAIEWAYAASPAGAERLIPVPADLRTCARAHGVTLPLRVTEAGIHAHLRRPEVKRLVYASPCSRAAWRWYWRR